MSWRPISSYPKDGTLVLLLFMNGDDAPFCTEDEKSYRTIGFNSKELNGEDYWQYVGWDWCHDIFLNVAECPPEPVYWCPLPELPG